MSYALAFAGDASLALGRLAPRLQEEVLDELEILTKDPSPLPNASPGQDILYAFSRAAAGVRYHVFLTLSRLGITFRVVSSP